MRLVILALFLAGCSGSPVAPIKPERANMPVGPGQPGGTEPWYHGFYSDGASRLSVGQGRAEATIVSLIGDSVQFHCQEHREYITGRHDESWMFGLYDTERKGFWVEMDKVTDDREEYVSRFLVRQP
jgi:hypothetical protein